MSRRIPVLLAALGVLTGAAHATENEHELALDAGLVTMNEEAMRVFAPHSVMPLVGVRAGYALDDRFSLVAGLHTGQRGLQITDRADSTELFRTAYRASTLTAALKVDEDVVDGFAPYVIAGVVGHLGLVRLDDDPTRRDHPGQLRRSALSVGATAAAGAQFRFGTVDLKVRPTLSFELGWQGVLNHRYDGGGDDMLPLGYSGVSFKGSAGVLF